MARLDISEIKTKAIDFDKKLTDIKYKLLPKSFSWYPYGSMNNFVHLEKLLTWKNRGIFDPEKIRTILDIGPADGDNSFFLESLGFKVDIIEYAPTNFNGIKGAKLLKKKLKSKIIIYEMDLDSQFKLPRKSYDMVFFQGTLYHLKNPYYALEKLAISCRYCYLSTRVTKFAPDKRTNLSKFSLAYLVDERETNNDPTNYWMFTNMGLKRILKRTGWKILDYMTVGNILNSDPVTKKGDERAFCLLKSIRL